MHKNNESVDSNSPSWGQVAVKLVETLENHFSKSLAGSSVQSTSGVLMRFAADHSITVNTARRHLAAVTFLRFIMEPAAFLTVIEERCPPFNDIEYLKKIHDIDSATAKGLLDDVVSRRISRSELASMYQKIQKDVPNQRLQLAIRRELISDFHNQVFDALQNPTTTIFPKSPSGIFMTMPRKLQNFEFQLPDAVVKITEQRDVDPKVCVHAVEIRVPNVWAKHEMWQIVERIQLMSTFFDATWIFMPSPHTNEQAAFTNDVIRFIKILRLTSVGLVTCAVASEVKLEVVLHPSGPSEIDRRYLFPLYNQY